MASDLTLANDGDSIGVRFLVGDDHTAVSVAEQMVSFIRGAQRSLDLAFYDVRLSDECAGILRQALQDRIAAGVTLRLCYDAGPKPQTGADIESKGSEPATPDTHERIAELGLPDALVRMVSGHQSLMHHKYLIRDNQAVWTGSVNLTDDSFSRMDNTILTLDSPELAGYFTRDFEQLWTNGRIENSGAFGTSQTALMYGGISARVDVDFSPGQGEHINAWVADRVLRARKRVVVSSMLFTSSRLLRALETLLRNPRVEVWGVYDRTQMGGVLYQWSQRDDLAWKVAAVNRVITEGNMAGKNSTPYRPGGSHNFMHNKTIVVDDAVLTGSHNFSHAAQDNAENLLLIENAALAEDCVAFTQRLIDAYDQDRGVPPTPREHSETADVATG